MFILVTTAHIHYQQLNSIRVRKKRHFWKQNLNELLKKKAETQRTFRFVVVMVVVLVVVLLVWSWWSVVVLVVMVVVVVAFGSRT